MPNNNSIPEGLCQCGCGGVTGISKKTKRGYKPGERFRYISGHNSRVDGRAPSPPPNPSGICHCGCGQRTAIAAYTVARQGAVKGEYRRYVHGHNRLTSGVEYIVDPVTGCWNWQRTTNSKGYGRTTVKGRNTAAHVALYERHRGPVPDGLELDHVVCQNRRCVNPWHLEAVTHQVNMQRARNSKLTPESVKGIRALYGIETSKEIAARFGITPGHVRRVAKRMLWENIE